ncbi:MAG: 50S ribosomal protein L13 [Roseiflexaceae bacterium]|jgi:large subunit ribosomal protein L13|nr:50S ribosomal protein L13 [Chloroflexaceae bacterium]MCE2853629.1 50S ribosomal protein L13 [Chloroflexaceae bacterium]
MKTYSQKASEVSRQWYVIDGNGQTVGRLATQIATLLRGKHKPTFSPNIDGGDFVVIINAEKIQLIGKKQDQKMYYRHSNYPGGFKQVSYRRMLATHPDRIIRHAVKGMLPKTRLGRQQLVKLRVYAGATHPHAAQQPQVFVPKGR